VEPLLASVVNRQPPGHRLGEAVGGLQHEGSALRTPQALLWSPSLRAGLAVAGPCRRGLAVLGIRGRSAAVRAACWADHISAQGGGERPRGSSRQAVAALTPGGSAAVAALTPSVLSHSADAICCCLRALEVVCSL